MKANVMKRIAMGAMALVLLLAMIGVPGIAASEGQEGKILIYLTPEAGADSDSVTVVAEGREYHGTLQRNVLELETEADHDFGFEKGESMEVTFRNDTSGDAGILTLTHREGAEDDGAIHLSATLELTPKSKGYPKPRPEPQIKSGKPDSNEIQISDEPVPMAQTPGSGTNPAPGLLLGGLLVLTAFCLSRKPATEEKTTGEQSE